MNYLNKSALSKLGWIVPTLASMVEAHTWAMSLNPRNDITITQGQPQVLAHQNLEDLLAACKVAAAGVGTKDQSPVLWPTPAADISISLTPRVWGVYVRVSDNPINFGYGKINVQFLDNATVIGDIWVACNVLPVEIVMLGVQNMNGQAQVTGVATPKVRFLAATNIHLTAGKDCLFAETLNERDTKQMMR